MVRRQHMARWLVRLGRSVCYGLIALEWLALTAALLPLLINSSFGRWAVPEGQSARPVSAVPVSSWTPPGWLLWLLGTLFVAWVLGFMVYLLLYKYPRTAIHTAEQAVQKATTVALPPISHAVFRHHTPTKAKQRGLSRQVRWWITTGFILAPVGGLWLLWLVRPGLLHDLILFAAAVCALAALVLHVLLRWSQRWLKASPGSKNSSAC